MSINDPDASGFSKIAAYSIIGSDFDSPKFSGEKSNGYKLCELHQNFDIFKNQFSNKFNNFNFTCKQFSAPFKMLKCDIQ